MNSQMDMFGRDPNDEEKQSANRATNKKQAPKFADAEEMARALEATGAYRVIRKLVPPEISAEPRPGFPRIGVIVDTETTGLNHRSDHVIEIGAVSFTFNDAGEFGDVIGTYGALQQPAGLIPATITKLTGITDDMVAGQSIDQRQLELVVGPADLVIAHNAAFDRPFCEKLSGAFGDKAWACSVSEVDWTSRNFEGSKLGYLIGQAGYFHDGHRAVDDCFALLEVLTNTRGPDATTPFAELYQASLRERARIFAENSPFDMKDKLKARGYRWSDGSDGRPKSWWIEVLGQLVEDELQYLRTEIYNRADAEPLVSLMTAVDRFRANS